MKTVMFIAALCMGAKLAAQTPAAAPAPSFYAEVEFMKVEPGKEADYLKTEALWKKYHQRRVANKQIMYWSLYRRIYPSGTGAENDYFTVTAYQTGNEIEDRGKTMTLADITKGMAPEEITLAQNTEKTRKLADRQLLRFRSGLDQNQRKPGGSWITITSLKVAPENREEFMKNQEIIKNIETEGVKEGVINDYSFWSHTRFFNAASPANFYAAASFATLDAALQGGQVGRRSIKSFIRPRITRFLSNA